MTNVVPVMVMRQFGPEPMDMDCPNCNQHIKTVISYKVGALTWILCIFVCICVLCCDCSKDVEHRCPSCNTYLGIYKRL
uniref:LITAF domain-containing protein n=1 Tax=Acrobeloides nanus TaxID=290746 RepID=A0A914D8D1_9BILA